MAERDPDLSRAVRIDLAQPGILTDSDGGQLEVVVRDLSRDGCKLETDGSLIEGEAVLLKVGKGAPMRAVVAWSRGLDAGLQFTDDALIG